VLPRDRVGIMVLNGNGRNGAAAAAAVALHRLGYRIAGTANAARMDYAASLILYRPGYRAEGLRLARDLGVRIVGPLDGMRRGALRGGELAVILGA
jgi:LytR cell envelope-related transcriptional attenuator